MKPGRETLFSDAELQIYVCIIFSYSFVSESCLRHLQNAFISFPLEGFTLSNGNSLRSRQRWGICWELVAELAFELEERYVLIVWKLQLGTWYIFIFPPSIPDYPGLNSKLHFCV